MRLFSVYQGVGNFRTLVSRISFSLFLSPFLRLSFPPAPSITRACNRAVAEHDFDFAEDKSQFVYVSFGERDRTPSCEGFGRRQDLPLLPILRISKAIPGLSPSLSLRSHPASHPLCLLFKPRVDPPSFFRLASLASSPPLRFRSRGNLQELLEMDRPAGWKPTPDFTRGIYANNRGNYVSVGARHGSSAHNQREK